MLNQRNPARGPTWTQPGPPLKGNGMSPPMVENAGSGARRKTALIVEGGAMRGAWAAGVLAYLQERGRRQYDFVYAASSGACSAVYFVADMWEPGLAIWRELACKVVRKSNFLRRKPIIDLAYLVDHIIRQARSAFRRSAAKGAHPLLHRADRLSHGRTGLLPCLRRPGLCGPPRHVFHGPGDARI